MAVFFFFSIYFIRFAFCEVISLFAMIVAYNVKRTITFELKRRPIPDTIRIYRFTPILKKMYVMSMLVNSFTIVFNDDFLEYDMNFLYSIFVTNMTESNLLTFKLMLMVLLVVVLLVLTFIFAKIGNLFGASKDLESTYFNTKNERFTNSKNS
jgi:hypothetical protein